MLRTFWYDEKVSGVFRPLKQWSYATSNSGSNRRNGKVETAKRWNYVTIGGSPFTIDATETYTYAGIDGRPSARTTSVFDGTSTRTFSQSWTYDSLGQVTALVYPQCTFTGCTDDAPPSRTVNFTYGNGFLTQVNGYASSLTYHPNQQPNQVFFQNGQRQRYTLDPNSMSRPNKIETLNGAGTPLWTTGTYAYDGAGNIKKMGDSWYRYDVFSRMIQSATSTALTAVGSLATQNAGYDAWGNLLSLTNNGVLRNIPVTSATNRLTASASTVYDARGNLTAWNGQAFQFDGLNMAWEQKPTATEQRVNLYTADDERIWQYQVPAPNTNFWAVRDLDGKVLREFKQAGAVWTVERDYIYRGGTLLASETPAGRRYFTTDHLGTPRHITDAVGATVSTHTYFPYGEEASAFNADDEQMKFTGHERDLGSTTSAADDLDYMHARHYGPLVGRFLSVDPIGGNPRAPLSWNRYSYVVGNPMTLVDPTGMLSANDPNDPHTDSTTVCVVADSGAACASNPLAGTLTLLIGAAGYQNLGSLNALPRELSGLRFGAAVDRAASLGMGGDYSSPNAQMLQELAFHPWFNFFESIFNNYPWVVFGAAGPVEALSAVGRVGASATLFGDFIRWGTTDVPAQLVKGQGATGSIETWGLKSGGFNKKTGVRLSWHKHVHKHNWYRPWTWGKYTPTLRD